MLSRARTGRASPPLSKDGEAYDVESGGVRGNALTLRRLLTRRSRVVLGVFACVLVVYYYGFVESSGAGRYAQERPPVVPIRTDLDELLPVDNIWDEMPPPIDDSPLGNAAAPPKRPPRPDDRRYYVIDKHGDHYLTNIGRKIAPLHPGPKDMHEPEDLFPDVEILEFLKAPVENVFPAERIREIVSPPLDSDNEWRKAALPSDSWNAMWQPPKKWDSPTPGVKTVQWQSFTTKDRDWESKEQEELRIRRREAVRRGFVYAWQKYKDAAWGHDEVKPSTGGVSDPFAGWGASIIDTLDTLLIMGLEDEYNLCRPHVNQLNFKWVNGKDWSQGYKAPPEEKSWEIPRLSGPSLAVFETGIRYLGGLLGAYDLSGDHLMLDRATDLAKILGRSFNTRSGLPQGTRFDPGAEAGQYMLTSVSVAEVGSMTLEMIRLSQASGDRQWFDLAQRSIEFLEKKTAPRSQFTPMIPMHFSPDSESQMGGSFSFGAMADSYYEYLIKGYKLLGGGEHANVYKKLYAGSIDAARKVLFKDITVVPNRDLMTIGKYEGGAFRDETEHLACFAGGMLALGAKLLDRPKDMKDATRFTQTCYWIGAASPLGIQPESVSFFAENDAEAYTNKTIYGENLHPPIKQPYSIDQYDPGVMYKSNGELFFRDDNSPVRNDSGRQPDHPIAYYRHIQGNPPGAKRTLGYYINRPETIESVFYMFRLTGDRAWQEKGWRMFGSWMNHSRVDHGISSIQDVTKPEGKYTFSDNMESFIFAETFKYHYLLQSEPDLISLDDYVLNTEAHTFIANHGDGMEPGSQGFWDPKSTKDQDLGVRGQGTNVQKWMREALLRPVRNRVAADANADPKAALPKPNAGPGRGMGGGYRAPTV